MPIYKVNGKTYDIPEDKISNFENAYPDAVVDIYDGDTGKEYGVPVSKIPRFKEQFPRWSYSRVSPSPEEIVNGVARGAAASVAPSPESIAEEVAQGAVSASSPTNGTAQGRENPSQKPWNPTERQKNAMSRQLNRAQARTDAMIDETGERMENLSEYYRNNPTPGFQTVVGNPEINVETGKLEKTYLTPTGDRTTNRDVADLATFNYRQAIAAADMSVGAQIRRAEAELAELRKQSKIRSDDIVAESHEFDQEKLNGPLGFLLHGETNARKQSGDMEKSALRVAIRQREQQLQTLYDERDRQIGKDVGFWRGFGRTVGDMRTWDLGTGDLLDAVTMVNADSYSSPDATEGEKQAGQEMMKAIHDNQQAEEMYGGNASFWNRAGVMAGYMPSFMIDFALTGGGFETINVAGKAATRTSAKLIGEAALKEMGKLGIKEYAKKYGIRGFGRMAGNWTIKALGTTADDLLIRAPLMTNTVQGLSTAADIIDRKLGDVTVDENGNYDFSDDKTWGSAIWQAEANSIIENYSEMFGAHLDGVFPTLAKTFGGKRISGMLARANSSGYGQILATTRKQFERLGISDYFGEVSEEYYGQLWRSMLNLDDAYTNVPVLDKEGNQVLDAEGNPVYERKNLLFTGQFHGDIWGGMALSMGLMGAGKYSISGIAYGNMKHQVNKADRRAAEIFTPDRWEPIREIIDNTTNEDFGMVAEKMVNDQNLSDDERSAVMEYMERNLNLRGFNLGAVAQSRGAKGNPAEQQLNESYIDGYESATPQEMTDAQNMYEYQRQRAEGMFEGGFLDKLDIYPIFTLGEMSRDGKHSQEEIDAALDYVNAKAVRDGMIQRVNDNIEEEIARSYAMIDGRVNRANGMIQPALMGLDDRQVYIVNGSLAVREDGTVDRERSDESFIVRDAVTGKLEFASPRAIGTVMDKIDPETEKAVAAENIRQQVARAAVDAMNGTLGFKQGDVIQINDGGGITDVSIVGPLVDENSGMPVEGQVVVQFPNGQRTAFTKEQLQSFADAANLERLNDFERERNAARAQQAEAEREAMRPKFKLNEEFTILDNEGNPIRGSITGELDEDGKVEIYTEEPINGNHVNCFTPAELEEIFDTYNGKKVKKDVTLPYGNRLEQNNDERAVARETDGGRVAADPAGGLEADRDRGDIRVYEEGLAASYNAHSEYSERTRRNSEAERLIGIARQQGQYIDKSDYGSLGDKQLKQTGESEVFIDKASGRVFKVKDPAAKSPMKDGVQPEDAIYEHLVHNKYFPETRYQFEGISDNMGDLRVVLSQGYVDSVDNATDEQIEAALAEKGLKPEGRYSYGNDEISVTDVTGDNALLGADGKVYFIDPIINFKKPVKAILGDAATNESALSRVPVDEKGQPKYDETDPDTAWDAIVEQAQGDEAIAAEVVADIVADREEDFNAAEKAYNKTKEGKPEKRKKGDPAPTMAERIAAKNAAKEALAEAKAIRDAAKAALDHWKKIAGTTQRRESERRAAEDAEARRRAQERAEEEARLKAEREETERIEREALNGVSDWNIDTPADARARGYRRNGPQKVDRPEIIDNHALGNAVEVKFGDDVMPKGNVVVIEAAQLQPSHRDGQRNPAHFLDEAQPKERKDAASRFAAAKIAETMRPEEITSSVTAYTGAPSINSRGEVIQGNNRSEALRIMYERYSQSADKYKQYLIDHAAEFGLTPEAIAAFEQPVLVNMLDVSDEDAITLGQYVAQDTESGGIERIKPKNAVQKMGDKIRTFANLLLRSSDDEATFAQLVDTNGLEVLKWMNQQGCITNTQYASAFDSKGNLSAEAANDLKGIMYQSIFTGGSTRLEEMFNKMPAKAQRAILATAFRDYDSPFADRMINEIQQSIIAFNALMSSEQFRDATNAEATMFAVEAWKVQYAFDDVTGDPYLPSETFSNFALALAAMYKGNTQKHIQSVFNMMYDIVQGTEQDNLFEVADKTPKPLAEAIRRALNIEYEPIVKPTTDNGSNGSPVLDINSENGQDGRPGSDGNPDGAEQPESKAEPSERGGQGNIHSTQRPEPSNLSQTEAEGIDYEYVLSDEMDQNGRPFVLTSKGDLEFGRIERQSGLAEAPILLSEGIITNPKTKEGYGLIHIEARHGKQIRQNGYANAVEFIEDVANNWEAIMEAKDRNGNPIFRLIAKGKHNNTIMVELSGDGTYWNINTAGIFKTSYGKNAKEVYNRHTTDKPIAESVEASQDSELSGTTESSRMNAPTSDRKVTNSASDKQESKAESSAQPSDNKGEQTIQTAVEAASAEVNTTPTPAQIEAGNYKKGHVQVGTFDVTIEQPVGSVRRGKDADGNEWETTMQNTYGYIRGTEGVDGDHIDVFLSTDIDGWNGRKVFVVDQYNPDGTFDEHKVMLGFNGKTDAINAYLANYEKGWEKGRRLVFSTAALEDFEKWIESSHRKQKPYHEYKIAEKAEVEESNPENPISATDYTIDTYTTKKNKTYHRVVFPHADKEVWQERLNLAKKMGGTSVPKGYGFKTREEAEAFAKAVVNPETVADAQPLSLEDMRPTTGIAQVDVEGLMTQLSQTGEANLADFSTPVNAEEAKPTADKPVNPSGNKLVTDERYAELRERMRKKLGRQLNMGVDPEILAIGTEMAVYHIEKGARKFKAYASAMIADLGDAIRPYLKAFYNAVRDMPEAEAAGLVSDMDSYDEVRSVDIANFDKPGTDAMATAAAVVAEQEAETEKAEAERKLQAYRHLVNKYAQDIANNHN